MGVCKAALESVNRYLARDLGPQRIRANLIAAGPLHTRATGIPGLTTPGTAKPFLLSDLAHAITGEIVHVDGGYHAMAAVLQQEPSLLSAAEATPGQQLTTAPVRQRLISASPRSTATASPRYPPKAPTPAPPAPSCTTRLPAAHPACRRTIVTQQDKNRNNLTSCEAHPPNRSIEAEGAHNRGRRFRRPIGMREPWVTNGLHGLAQASTFLSGNR